MALPLGRLAVFRIFPFNEFKTVSRVVPFKSGIAAVTGSLVRLSNVRRCPNLFNFLHNWTTARSVSTDVQAAGLICMSSNNAAAPLVR